jgi:hypothetical protein
MTLTIELDKEAVTAPREAFFLTMPDNAVALEHAVAATDDKPARKGRFKMRVNSGIPMSHPWFGTLAVNLSGISWKGKHVPALADHDTTKRLGYTTKLYVDEDEGLVAEGVMLSNEDATKVRTDSAEGFPFQASCYLQASKMLQLEEGAEHEVNGHVVLGPALIFEESELGEVTMCALGQDPNTSSDASLSNSDERIRVPLSVKVSTMTTTKETTSAPIPAEPMVDAEKLRKEVQLAEQERVNDILELSADCQVALAKKLISDNVTAIAAAKALNADMRERDANAAPATVPTTNTTALSAPAPAVVADPINDLPEGEDKWRRQWASDAKLRAEFTNEEVFLSYERNKHFTRDYGSKSRFNGAIAQGNSN